VSNAQEPIPDYYITARLPSTLRELAQISRLTGIRSDLLELSARFERMAAYVEAGPSASALPGYPCGELISVVRDNPQSQGESVPSATDLSPRGLGRTRKRRAF